MLWIILTVAGLYSLYWFNGGPDFGARYWYLIQFSVIALSVEGLFFIANKLPNKQFGMTQALTGVAALCFSSIIVFFPWRSVDRYFHYRYMHPGIQQLAKNHDFSNSLVLIKGERFPDYMSAAVYNDLPVHNNNPVYAWDRNKEIRMALLKSFPDKVVWLVNGPSITGSNYKLIQGPVSGKDLLRTMSSIK